jgi:hypothetical protein
VGDPDSFGVVFFFGNFDSGWTRGFGCIPRFPHGPFELRSQARLASYFVVYIV